MGRALWLGQPGLPGKVACWSRPSQTHEQQREAEWKLRVKGQVSTLLGGQGRNCSVPAWATVGPVIGRQFQSPFGHSLSHRGQGWENQAPTTSAAEGPMRTELGNSRAADKDFPLQ